MTDTFDFIVVGGGSSGCIVAAELARDGVLPQDADIASAEELLDTLEELDDVQNVFTNAEIDEELIDRL